VENEGQWGDSSPHSLLLRQISYLYRPFIFLQKN